MCCEMSAPVVIRVDAWSDLACPWCYVGKARLDKAIEILNSDATYQHSQVSVHWHPYMIDINTNNAGEEYLAYNQRRWGSDGWTASLRRSAAKDGLRFKDWKWWPNTLHAHRLVLLADTLGKGGEAKQKLFKMTYEEGLNISDLEVLCSAADQLGLPGAREFLMSDQGKEEVIEQDRAAKSERKIDSVPFFIVDDDRHSFSGAQDASTIGKVLQKAVQQQQKRKKTSSS